MEASARSTRARTLATVGLACTLLSLAALSLLGADRTRDAAETVSQSSLLADAYARANRAVAAQESLERRYRLDGSEVVRVRHATAVQQVFVAVDNGDTARAAAVNIADVDPVFDALSTEIQRAADSHTATAAAAVADLRRVETLVFGLMLAGFTVGLVLVGALAYVFHTYQRALVRQSALNEHAARHDALTGLPNRTLYTDRLRRALSTGGPVAVMLLDLDRFKEVNDTLGHHYGDELLIQVADRLSHEVRDSDTVARLAGDEFAILLPGADADAATTIAARILTHLHRSFTLRDVTVDVEASVGIAVAPHHATTADDLVRCADVAMYCAKDTKNGAVLFAEPATATTQPNRLQLLGDLRRALEQPDEITVHYQPKVTLPAGDLCGVEALVRWQHPTRGLVPPGEFIPVAENTGLINMLTTHVLRRAIAQAAAWLADGMRIPVAVNLSTRCLVDTGLVGRVRDLLDAYRLPADLLRLEVTESAVMADPATATATLHDLHRLGIHLSIDDYGTGYSSMAYLRQLPVDEIKIDRSFVLTMTGDNDDVILVRSAIDLGHNLGLTVVAEGVEHAEHVTALHRLGCDVAQGYHYARPMPPAQLVTWLHARRTPALTRD